MKPLPNAERVPLQERLSLSVHQAAELSGLTVTLLSEAISCGLLRASKLGRKRMILRGDLEKLLLKGTGRPPLNVRRVYKAHLQRMAEKS